LKFYLHSFLLDLSFLADKEATFRTNHTTEFPIFCYPWWYNYYW